MSHLSMNDQNFGKQLKDWRAREKISQSRAALRLKLPLRTLQHWEQGRMKPNEWRWREITGKIGITTKGEPRSRIV